MNDPHVEELHCRVQHGDQINYTKAPPFEHEEKDFRIRIADRRAQITMKAHFPSLADARLAIEPFLRAWELDMALSHGPTALEFKYERGRVIDRKPTPGVIELEPVCLEAEGTVYSPTVTLQFNTFPSPPGGMARDSVVDLMFNRYVLYRDGGTTLADAANYCRTEIEEAAASPKGRRKAAAAKFSIKKEVLDKLGDLAANKGGAKARKAAGSETDFTAAERQWLEQAMTLIIRRASEVAFNPNANHRLITMADLPRLP